MIDNYNKLSVGKYEEICRICESDREDIDKQVAVLSILTGKSCDDILNTPITEYQALVRQSSFLDKDTPKPNARVAHSYRLGDYDLRPVSDVPGLTTAQYIDFQTLTKDGSRDLACIASVFLIPKGFKYNYGYDLAEVQKAIRENMSIVEMGNLLAFFLQKLIGSIKATLTYSGWIVQRMKGVEREKMTRQIRECRTALQTAMAGSATLTQFPKPSASAGMKC